MAEMHYKKRKGLRIITRKRRVYDQASALGPVLILEKLSSTGETLSGRPANGYRGCTVSAPNV